MGVSWFLRGETVGLTEAGREFCVFLWENLRGGGGRTVASRFLRGRNRGAGGSQGGSIAASSRRKPWGGGGGQRQDGSFAVKETVGLEAGRLLRGFYAEEIVGLGN